MNIEFIGFIAMTALNIIQFIFWSWQNQRLVNKLMSRNFAEYDYVIHKPKEDSKIKSHREYESELEEQEILSELNGLLPK